MGNVEQGCCCCLAEVQHAGAGQPDLGGVGLEGLRSGICSMEGPPSSSLCCCMCA